MLEKWIFCASIENGEWIIKTENITRRFLHGQEGIYRINWFSNGKIVTNVKGQPQEIEYLRFENASFIADYIPEYRNTFMITGSDRKFVIENLQYEAIPDSLLNNVYLPQELTVGTSRLHAYGSRDKTRYIDVSIPAIRIDKSGGKVERLVEFEIVGKPEKEDAKKDFLSG